MKRTTQAVVFLLSFLFFSPSPLSQPSREELISETESAYNPIPSPDGKMIAYVRTGRWEKGSGGFGQSNLRSEVKIMDSQGRILTDIPLAETFLAGWTADGKHLICHRNWGYFLVSLDGEKSKAVSYSADIVDRGTYLESLDAMVFVEHFYQPSRGVLRTADEVVARNNESHLGEMLVPSPDRRYVAAIDVTRWADDLLWVYDLQNKSWANLGKATVHPSIIYPNNNWDWMQATWDPWYRDSSHLAFISGSSIVVSTPDGKSRQTIAEPGCPIGLATPSPDGKLIAYVTFDAELNKEQPHWTFWGNTRVWVVPTVPGAKARPVTNRASETTLDLRWLNNREIVFDRLPQESFTNHARLWKVRVE
jgi:Tol biopolymer transport system component